MKKETSKYEKYLEALAYYIINCGDIMCERDMDLMAERDIEYEEEFNN